jgi:hypothetical protein
VYFVIINRSGYVKFSILCKEDGLRLTVLIIRGDGVKARPCRVSCYLAVLGRNVGEGRRG